MELKEFKTGLFAVQMDEKTAVQPSEIEKNIAGFDLRKVEVTLRGVAGETKAAFVFTARKSNWRLELQNPEKAKEDFLDKIRKEIAGADSHEIEISGVLKEVSVEGQKEPKLVLEVTGSKLLGKK